MYKQANIIKIELENIMTKTIIESEKDLSTLSDHAEHVLKKHGKKHSMHYLIITEIAKKQQNFTGRGKTPKQSVFHAMSHDERFKAFGGGFFGLIEWENNASKTNIQLQLKKSNTVLKEKLKAKLIDINGKSFEKFICEKILKIRGFKDIKKTKDTRDGGIDAICRLDGAEPEFAVQIKNTKQKITAPEMRKFRGSLGNKIGLFITSNDFTKDATNEAQREDVMVIGLINGEDIINLMIRHKIGLVESLKIDANFSYFKTAHKKIKQTKK